MTGTLLIVMRLADMERVHPNQITGQCSGCGHVVGIYPSGQQAMKAHPDIKIVCQVCKPPGGNLQLAPGAELEPFQSIKKWLQ
jgi:hypothetical protein